jgi:glycosyltransferase involved in cell wall biosynthesis
VRLLVDYRSALRGRSGVGEYAHELIKGLLSLQGSPRNGGGLDITVFSSSWKDRLDVPDDLERVAAVDRRVPVSLLNFAWHRLEWPPVEMLTGGQFDLAHSLHPLLMPTRQAAQVVTVHDLNFLSHPERTRGEIRRDYPSLARRHAQRADHVIVPSKFTAAEVERRLEVPAERISVCSPGAPDWAPRREVPRDAYILFFGTLEPRKNVGVLLEAYQRLLAGAGRVPDLVLAGSATEQSRPWLDRIALPPLAGRVRHIGYVDPSRRQTVYERACLLVQPSFEEGFGIPVLEAMTLGVPVVAADRGALPEVLGNAGLLVDPTDAEMMASAMARMLTENGLAEESSKRGVERSRRFRWSAAAATALDAYNTAVRRRAERRTSAS